MDILLIYIFSVVIGCFIGSAKGRFGSGLVWSLLFGPLGVLVVLSLPNLKKQKEDGQRNKLMQAQLELQRTQLQQLQQIQQRIAAPPPPHANRERTFRIARNGDDLGPTPVSQIKQMLSTGQLTMQDYYFDAEAKDWLPLDCLPDVV